MAKADQQAAASAYDDCMRRAFIAEAKHDFQAAIRCAEEAWEYVDDMMKYRRRYESVEFDSTDCIDLVTKLAPLRLNHEVLDRCLSLLRQKRYIDKHTENRLIDTVTTAQQRTDRAGKALVYIAHHPEVSTETICDECSIQSEELQHLTTRWLEMNVLDLNKSTSQHTLRLTTDFERSIVAKCPCCGTLAQAPKRNFFTEQRCPTCHETASFVLTTIKPKSAGDKS